MRLHLGITACGLFALAACNQDGTGYVELKTVPGAARLPAIYLASSKIDAKPGATVLRQAVGTAKLEIDGADGKVLLCQVEVKKNRITTVTLSPLDRPPRCQCERTSGSDGAAGRICIG